MIFNKAENKDEYECVDWVDHYDDERIVGILFISDACSYWHFKPEHGVVLGCGTAKRIAAKLSDLNKAINLNT